MLETKEATTIYKFYADWCGPCKMQTKILEDLKNNGVEFELVNIDIESEEDVVVELVKKYAVMSIPTMVFFKKNEEPKIVVGLKSKEALLELI